MLRSRIYGLLLFFLVFTGCQKANYTAIAPPWEPDYKIDRSEKAIIKFEEADKQSFPGKGGIVMIGSSSFTMWRTSAEDLAPLHTINRGFGGNTLPEVIYYLDRTVFPYEPSKVVVYCENDMFGKKTKTPEQTRDAYVELTRQIREKFPKVKMYFVSLKPSPSRVHKQEDVIKTNQLIGDFVKKDKNHEYIDVWPVMMKDGRPDGSIFLKDSLHMNREGYERWIKVIKPALSK